MKLSAKCLVGFTVQKKGEHSYDEEIHEWFNVTLSPKYVKYFQNCDNEKGKKVLIQGFLQSPQMDKLLMESGLYERGMYSLIHKTVQVTDYAEGHSQEETQEMLKEESPVEETVEKPKEPVKKKAKAKAKKKVIL